MSTGCTVVFESAEYLDGGTLGICRWGVKAEVSRLVSGHEPFARRRFLGAPCIAMLGAKLRRQNNDSKKGYGPDRPGSRLHGYSAVLYAISATRNRFPRNRVFSKGNG